MITIVLTESHGEFQAVVFPSSSTPVFVGEKMIQDLATKRIVAELCEGFCKSG